MQRLLQVARKDFRDSMRERQLYFLGGFFLLVGALMGYIVGQSTGASGSALGRFSLMALLFVGPLTATVVSYNGIVGKRESGEMRVLLSLPFARGEVVLGTLLGRLGVLVAVSTLTLLLATVIAAAMGAAVSATHVLGALAVLSVALLAFVSIAVGISASTRTTTRAAGAAFGAFFLFLFRLWEVVPISIRFVANGLNFPRGQPPTWAVVWGQLSPLAGLRNAVSGVSTDLAAAFGGFVPTPPVEAEALYLEPWFGAGVVVVWIVAPVAIGLYRFGRADL